MQLTPTQDASPADWILDGIEAREHTVRGMVPDVFDSYCRVLHPAHGYERAANGSIENEKATRWGEIAEANGRVLHPEVQFDALIGVNRYAVDPINDHGQEPLWSSRPEEGSLELETTAQLADLLARHTGSDRWYFAYWNGYGSLAVAPDAAPAFGYPWENAGREHMLFEGPSEAVGTMMYRVGYRSPNLWWPEDRAWLIASDIDLDSTYIGGSQASINEIFGVPWLEVVKAEPSHGVTSEGDKVNLVPPWER